MHSSSIKQWSNATLAVLGIVALAHSVIRFGTGELPEAIFAGILFWAAFSNRKQPAIVVVAGLVALVIVWIVNSGSAGKVFTATLLSGVGIVLFAILGFSRFLLRTTENKSKREMRE